MSMKQMKMWIILKNFVMDVCKVYIDIIYNQKFMVNNNKYQILVGHLKLFLFCYSKIFFFIRYNFTL